MRLISFDYTEFKNGPQEWSIEGLALKQVNLLVGRNAVGKSRTLSAIKSLARLVCNQQKEMFLTGRYLAAFDADGSRCAYELDFDARHIAAEKYTVAGEVKLHRGRGGSGRIFAEQLNGNADKMMRFQTPDDRLAVVARLDSVQHSFLEALNVWGSSTRAFDFGSPLGRHALLMIVKWPTQQQLDDADPDQVAAICKQAIEKFSNAFVDAVKSDMSAIGYEIDDILLTRPISVQVFLPGDLLGIAVKERGLNCPTDQTTISQGMFRALSVLIQINYAQLARTADCVIIDDIGEGLDFERSSALIELLRQKAYSSNFQLIMSTNDRFVMNKVPLEEWSFLQRTGHAVRVFNYDNSKETFDRFKVTGLNNFDLLTTDFLSEAAANG